MLDPFDPAAMTPEERAREVACILARGFLRRLARRPSEALTSTEKDLDVPPDHAPSCVPGERP